MKPENSEIEDDEEEIFVCEKCDEEFDYDDLTEDGLCDDCNDEIEDEENDTCSKCGTLGNEDDLIYDRKLYDGPVCEVCHEELVKDKSKIECGSCGDKYDKELLYENKYSKSKICSDCIKRLHQKLNPKTKEPITKKEDAMVSTSDMTKFRGKSAGKKVMAGVPVKKMVKLFMSIAEKKYGKKLPPAFYSKTGKQILEVAIPVGVHFLATGPLSEFKASQKVAEVSSDAYEYTLTRLLGDHLEEYLDDILDFFNNILEMNKLTDK